MVYFMAKNIVGVIGGIICGQDDQARAPANHLEKFHSATLISRR